MANEKIVAGKEGTLALAVASAWKPVGCLTSSAYSATLNMIERVSMCTNGETVQSPKDMTRSVQIEGLIVDTTAVGGQSVDQSADELRELQESQAETGTPAQWRLSRGPLGDLYFSGFISDFGDNYPAGEDATFSATLTVQAKPATVDPLV